MSCRNITSATEQQLAIITNLLYNNYIAITIHNFRSIDSLQHLSTSLDSLVSNLHSSGESNFKLTREYIDMEHDGSNYKFDLMTRNGVYPYSYIDNVETFKEGWNIFEKPILYR